VTTYTNTLTRDATDAVEELLFDLDVPSSLASFCNKYPTEAETNKPNATSCADHTMKNPNTIDASIDTNARLPTKDMNPETKNNGA
jgi:hypothetical protein